MSDLQLQFQLSTITTTASKPRVAFISGHIDIHQEQFLQQYQQALDLAIQNNEHFVLSNSVGADSLALEYLISHNVHPSRITVYLHTSKNEPRSRVEATINKYRRRGLMVKVIQGWHTERDAAMTAASDYDILWVRTDEETQLLYGAKYRPGRISGTQKNKNRRVEMMQKLSPC